MKKHLGCGIVATLLLLAFLALVLSWMINDDPIDPALQNNVNGVHKIDIRVYNRRIYVDVYLDNPKTCNDVVKILGIRPLVLRSKLFVPSCTEVNPRLIKIIYGETIES